MRLPPIEDMRKLACLQVLQLMFVHCLLVRPKLAPYVNVKMMKITLLHGMSPISSMAFATYGLICRSAFRDVDSAIRYEFGQDIHFVEHSRKSLTEFFQHVYPKAQYILVDGR
jgi:hypothetical protein